MVPALSLNRHTRLLRSTDLDRRPKSPHSKMPPITATSPPRQKIILRSDNLTSSDFGALFSRLFGNRYADTRRHLPTSSSAGSTGGTTG